MRNQLGKFFLIFFLVILNIALNCACPSTQIESPKPTVESKNLLIQTEKIDPKWVYINKNIRWESPPKEIDQTFQASLNSTVVIFYPDGKFASIGLTIYRDNKTKRMNISMGDDFSVLKGFWKESRNEIIEAKANLTHGSIENYPEQHQSWEILQKSSERLADSLKFNGEIYIPLPDVGNFETISPMLADENLPRPQINTIENKDNHQ